MTYLIEITKMIAPFIFHNSPTVRIDMREGDVRRTHTIAPLQICWGSVEVDGHDQWWVLAWDIGETPGNRSPRLFALEKMTPTKALLK